MIGKWGWRALLIGNSRVTLAISAAFAAPLLRLLDIEGGGLHFRGSSSIGKTTVLHVAGSVWGGGGVNGYLRRWRTTDNGLEGVALLHCDTLLTLDEIAEVDAGVAAKAAYMLANGQGKSRAGRSGDVRPAREWRLLFISTGEIGLADKLGEDRSRRTTAGQEVRVVDLPADAGVRLGIFETLHGFNRASDLADHLKSAAARNYGHPSRDFLRRVTEDPEGTREKVHALVEEWLREHCPERADGQVGRVARRFAIIAAAGELASEMRVTGWPAGIAATSASTCFRDWLVSRGGIEPAEIRNGIDNVRSSIDRHGTSRFAPWDKPDTPVRDRAGFVKTSSDRTIYYFFADAFREACGGQDPGLIARALASSGCLELGNDGKPHKLVRLPQSTTPRRCYVLRTDLPDAAEAGLEQLPA